MRRREGKTRKGWRIRKVGFNSNRNVLGRKVGFEGDDGSSWESVVDGGISGFFFARHGTSSFIDFSGKRK